ncbi:hypothetical protein J1605_012758 [Eschrichtius robustus]|uniref:Uncharacterized protein n=1 Tax=Eschrichtius robustus TaxID=9764 RepID=A0AB34GI61_ESCRO|nr:hypothetical protein J1605_012758 [Eschrichtius robustus]
MEGCSQRIRSSVRLSPGAFLVATGSSMSPGPLPGPASESNGQIVASLPTEPVGIGPGPGLEATEREPSQPDTCLDARQERGEYQSQEPGENWALLETVLRPTWTPGPPGEYTSSMDLTQPAWVGLVRGRDKRTEDCFVADSCRRAVGAPQHPELEDYFYYSQLRSQGIDTMQTRKVSEHICLSELPFVMRAIGFYPSEEKSLGMGFGIRQKAPSCRRTSLIQFKELVPAQHLAQSRRRRKSSVNARCCDPVPVAAIHLACVNGLLLRAGCSPWAADGAQEMQPLLRTS